MSEAEAGAGLIGPNAILQLLPAIERTAGPERASALLARAGLSAPPDGASMIPEGDAARLHRSLREEEPQRAALLAEEAGLATARYLLANRIPSGARAALRLMPAPLAARALSRAISAHAWTFAGSGRFRALDPWRFEIAANPLVAGERSARPLCHWHAAVFTGLYARLVHPEAICRETICAAQGGDICRFEIERG